MNQLELAYAEWRARVDKGKRPDGAGFRWYPSPKEIQPCCEEIRQPSRQYPLSLLSHCKSAKHVANLFGVDRKDLLAMHKRMRANYTPREIVSEKTENEWGWF